MGIFLFNILSIPIYRWLFKNDKVFCIIVSFQMFLILALRSDTLGVDLVGYAESFETVKSWSRSELVSVLRFLQNVHTVGNMSYESGFAVLNWIVGNIGLNFHGLLVLLAAFNMVSVGYFVYRYSDYKALSFSMFIGLTGYAYCFGILRHCIAFCIFLWAIPCLEKNKVGRYIVYVAIAFMFQRTSIVFLLPVLFYKFRISKKSLTFIILSWVIALSLSQKLFNYLLIPVMNYLGKYPQSAFRWNKLIILMFLISILIWIFIDKRIFKSDINRILMWTFIVSVYIEIIGMNDPSVARIVNLIFIVMIVLVPNIIKGYPKRDIRTITILGIYIMMVGFMVISYERYNIIPYRLFFQ